MLLVHPEISQKWPISRPICQQEMILTQDKINIPVILNAIKIRPMILYKSVPNLGYGR